MEAIKFKLSCNHGNMDLQIGERKVEMLEIVEVAFDGRYLSVKCRADENEERVVMNEKFSQ